MKPPTLGLPLQGQSFTTIGQQKAEDIIIRIPRENAPVSGDTHKHT